MLRDQIHAGTELGKLAQITLSEGKLFPDDSILGLVKARLSEDDAADGFILDGFPRTVPQGVGLGVILEHLAVALDAIVVVEVKEDVLLNRLTARRTCTQCGAIYNLVIQPPKVMGVCDRCGGKELIQRDDDKPETIQKRLNSYRRQTVPLLSYYRPTGLIAEVNGESSVDEVFQQILAVLPQPS